MEKNNIFKNSPAFCFWIFFLLLLFAAGLLAFLTQQSSGFELSGLTRYNPLGLYEGQFVFFSCISSGLAVALLSCYLLGQIKFMPITLWLAVCAILLALLFMAVSLGKPERYFYIFFSPNFSSLRFWVHLALFGYLLSLIFLLVRSSKPKLIIFLAVFLAAVIPVLIGILHQNMFAGVLANSYLRSASLVPRFLTLSVSCGTAFLLLSLFTLKNFTRVYLDRRFMGVLTSIITCALIFQVFFYVLELADTFYNALPGQLHFSRLFFGLDGTLHFANLIMWLAAILALLALLLLLLPQTRKNKHLLPWSLTMLLVSAFLEQGLGVNTGAGYTPHFAEVLVVMGLMSLGLALFSIGLKVMRKI